MKEGSVIQKTVIDFQYNGKEDGFLLQGQVYEWTHRNLLSAIEAEIDKADQPGYVMKIDKLEIDVEAESGTDWMDSLLQQIRNQLGRQLKRPIQDLSLSSLHPVLTASESFFKELIYFLQKGHFSWRSGISTLIL